MPVRRPAAVLAVLLATLGLADVQQESILPSQPHASTYSASEAHSHEKVAIGAEMLETPAEQAQFSLRYYDYGILPVRIAFSNDSARPISLLKLKVQLITRNGTKLDPISPDDVQRRIGRVRPPKPERAPLPIPLPRGNRNKQRRERQAELEELLFQAKAVEPRSTRSGYFFFDVLNVRKPLRGTRLYVTGLANDKGEELFYFEIFLEPRDLEATRP